MKNPLHSTIGKVSCVIVEVFGLLIIIGVITVCIRSGTYRPPEYDPPASGPPSELLELPREAFTLCLPADQREGRIGVALWEFPGSEPLDPNSSQGQGYKGDELAVADFCTPITIIDYAWSRWDAVYWAQIRYQETEGWMRVSSIQFNSPTDQ